MTKEEYKLKIEKWLSGTWVLQYDTPVQWLKFSKPIDETELGVLIMANSENLVVNRRRLGYEILIEDDLKTVYLNIYVKTSNQTLQWTINRLNTSVGSLWLDASTGEKWNYSKIQPHE